MKIITILICLILIKGCSYAEPIAKVKIAINPWPGYEFMYLASELGYFTEQGLHIEIIEAPSLAEVERLYSLGKVNAMATTTMEVISASMRNRKPTSIVLITDFSNGGDVILADKSIESLSHLKGKKIGAEIGALGTFFLHEALASVNLSIDEVEIVNTEQLDALTTFTAAKIDAVATYPPYSTELLETGKLHQIFSSKEIPETIVDVISVDSTILNQDPEWQKKLFSAWQKTLDYSRSNPQTAYQIMSQREGISVSDFEKSLMHLKLIPKSEQVVFLQSDKLKKSLTTACSILKEAKSFQFNCKNLFDYLKIAY